MHRTFTNIPLLRMRDEIPARRKKMEENKELIGLLEHRIPEARQQLKDSHKNLNDLATYCERNYIDSGQTPAALDETKKYAAQSLASVAYQVNILATGMLELLDRQMKQLGEMEANIHHISQVAMWFVHWVTNVLKGVPCSWGSLLNQLY